MSAHEVATLRRRAERAAAQIVSEYDLNLPGVAYDVVVAAVAVGWVEGRQAGADEAKAVVEEAIARYQRAAVGMTGLHSVKVTPRDADDTMQDGSVCPRCGIHVFPPAHSCHVSRANYVVA